MFSSELSSAIHINIFYAQSCLNNDNMTRTVLINDSHEIDTHSWNRFIGGTLGTIIALEDDQCICITSLATWW